MSNICLLQRVFKRIALIFSVVILIITMTACVWEKKDLDVKKETAEIARYFEKGEFNKSIKEYKKLLKKISKDEKKDIISVNCSLSICYTVIGKYDVAEQYLLESKQLSDEINLKDFPVDSIYVSYAHLENKKNNHEKAIEYFEEALKLRKTIYGENSKEVGLIYTQLAFTSITLGRYDNAEEWAQKALSLDLKYEESYNNMITTNSYVALGNICMEQKDYEKALVNYKEAEENYSNAGKPLGGSVSAMISDMINDAKNKALNDGS